MATPTIVQCQDFINNTTKYDDVKKTYDNLCNLQLPLSSFSYNLKDFMASMPDGAKEQEDPIKFENKQELIDTAKKFFRDLGGEYSEIAKVFDNSEIKFNINVQKVGYCTSYTTLDSENKSQHNLNITLDKNGLFALCHEMTNAYVISQARKNDRQTDSKNEHILDKSTNIAMSYLITDYILKNTPNLSEQERDIIKYNLFKELQFQTNYLFADQVAIKKLMESSPDSFDSLRENYSAENLLKAMTDATDHASASARDFVNDRIIDIAMTGNTSRYLQGNLALILSHMKNPTNNHITNRLKESALNTAIRQIDGGESSRDIINEGDNLVDDPSEDFKNVLNQYSNDPSIFKNCLNGPAHDHNHEDENVMVREIKKYN